MNSIIDNEAVVPGTEGISLDKPKAPPSSRQAIRHELFRRAMATISEKYIMPRANRRLLARQIAKDLWRRGERLQP